MKNHQNRFPHALVLIFASFSIAICLAPKTPIFPAVQVSEAKASETKADSDSVTPSTDDKTDKDTEGKENAEPDLLKLLSTGELQDVVEDPDRVETALLKLATEKERREYALTDPKHIAGFPISGPIKPLDPEAGRQAAKLLVNPKHYIPVRCRCKNQYMHGIRFTKDQLVVEFALGMPCQQLIAVIKGKDGKQWWGGVLRKDVIQAVISISVTGKY